MPAYPTSHVLRYGAHPEQLADLRLPGPQAPRALLLLIHGGFWREEWDRHHTEPMAEDLVHRRCAVASLEYRRLGGAGGWPATFDDVATAVDTVPSLAGAMEPSTRGLPVVAIGHSAGGQLALWAAGRHRLPAGTAWSLPSPAELRGVVALAPVADLRAAEELDLDDGVVRELFGDPVAQRRARMALVDPSALPPHCRVVVVHGDRDRHVPLALAQRYLASVRPSGSDVSLDVVEGAEHFAVIEPDSTAWPHVLSALDRVLAEP